MMRKTTDKALGAVLSAGVVAAAMGLLALSLLMEYFGGIEDASAAVAVVLCTLSYAAVAIGVLAALIQRLREIKGGEENEARKY